MKIPQKKFKAAILVELKKPLIIDEICLPENLEPGQVLVKIHFSGICGSQLGEIDGVKGFDNYLPHLLGHEGSGTVIEVGPGVRHVKPNDHVVMHWRKGQGIEAVPPTYMWGDKKVNAGCITTFSEYSIVSENRLTVIPENYNKELAALFGCAVTTGFGVIVNNAKLKIGESVIVYGAGGVGLNIIQAAAMTSAHPIIAVDLYSGRLEIAQKAGATHVINASTDDSKSEIEQILKNAPVDVFIDNTGVPKIIELGYSLTSAGGRVVLVGVPPVECNTSIYTLPLHFGKSISGSHGGETIPHVDIPRYLSLHKSGKMSLDHLITHRISLDGINAGINGMRNGSIHGRIVIDMDAK